MYSLCYYKAVKCHDTFSDSGQSYGQRRPSLTAVLRRILEGYPDGGQILKVQQNCLLLRLTQLVLHVTDSIGLFVKSEVKIFIAECN